MAALAIEPFTMGDLYPVGLLPVGWAPVIAVVTASCIDAQH